MIFYITSFIKGEISIFEEGLIGSAVDIVKDNETTASDTMQTEVQYGIDYFHNNQENLKGRELDLMQSDDPLKLAHLYKCVPFPGIHWVDTYMRTDGTIVDGHLKTNPDDYISNNLGELK